MKTQIRLKDLAMSIWLKEERTMHVTTASGRNLFLSQSLPGYGASGNQKPKAAIIIDGRPATLVMKPATGMPQFVNSQALEHFYFTFDNVEDETTVLRYQSGLSDRYCAHIDAQLEGMDYVRWSLIASDGDVGDRDAEVIVKLDNDCAFSVPFIGDDCKLDFDEMYQYQYVKK
jgi:hypothetical protein